MAEAIYGTPVDEVVEWDRNAMQCSPLFPGSTPLEALAPASLDRVVMAAPGGVLDRRYALALALRALRVGGELVAMAPKDRGGMRLRKELVQFGCDPVELAKAHQRVCTLSVPEDTVGLPQAIADGALRFEEELGLWTQPGIFSWDRVDIGTALLLEALPVFSGRGADFGGGLGTLARRILASEAVSDLTVVELDRRAVEAARLNLINDERAHVVWADVRQFDLPGLDFVVMNPPFHDGGQEDRRLGRAFIRKAAESLRKGGACWLVANRHLPYEDELNAVFSSVTAVRQDGGFKIYEARK